MTKRNIFNYAIKQTAPSMVGLFFMNAAFGMLLKQCGGSMLMAFATPLIIFSGAAQFIMLDFLNKPELWFGLCIMVFTINIRHIAYGISFKKVFRETGKAYPYMIGALCDETYTILSTQKDIIKEYDKYTRAGIYFSIASLNHLYCILGAVFGYLLASKFGISIQGIEFSLTAMFVVMLVNQWKKKEARVPIIIGLLCGLIAAIELNANQMVLPAILLATFALIIRRVYHENQTIFNNMNIHKQKI